MKHLFTLFPVLVLSAICANAQILSVKPSAAECPAYGRLDVEVVLKGEYENPYRQEEARLDMLVVSPDGSVLCLPAFHLSENADGTSVWNARFTPQMQGTYTYMFKYAQPGKESVSKSFTLESRQAEGHGILHTNDNWTLRYDDGTPYRGVGENICWESRQNDDSKFFKALHEQHDRFNYPVMLPKFAENGGNFIRVWMCSWNFPIDKKDNFNNPRYQATDLPLNESAAKRLDETVQLCENLGIGIMLCIGAGEARTNAEFFVNDKARAEHRNRLRYIVARWGYSPAIAMWEFFNEIDNIQFRDRKNPIPAADIVDWHAHMAKYLKSVDPYGHIVTTSISHRDLQGLNSVADMDINQKHIYNNTTVIPETIDRYEAEFGKPYIIGEFGYEWDWSKNFDDFADGMDMDFRRGLWYGLFCPTPVTPMSWWWEYFDNRDMVKYFKAPALVNREMLQAGNGSFQKVEASAGKAQAFAVKCGARTFVYVFNNTKASIGKITVNAKGQLRELDIERAQWGKARSCNGSIAAKVAPGKEKVFVID